MCLTTIVAIAAVASVASAAVGTMSAMNAAKAREGAAQYNAEVARQNATLSRSQGERQRAEQEKGLRAARSALLAKTGASGMLATSGSNLDNFLAQAEQDAKNLDMIGYNAELKARGFQNQADINMMEAASAQTEGQAALIGGGLNIAGTAASGYGSYLSAQNAAASNALKGGK